MGITNWLVGGRLEVFKFGLYLMGPIGVMLWIGTNTHEKLRPADFWPPPERLNRIPFEMSEIDAELARIKQERAERRKIREEMVRKIESQNVNAEPGSSSLDSTTK